jgi:hypothetical protein
VSRGLEVNAVGRAVKSISKNLPQFFDVVSIGDRRIWHLESIVGRHGRGAAGNRFFRYDGERKKTTAGAAPAARAQDEGPRPKAKDENQRGIGKTTGRSPKKAPTWRSITWRNVWKFALCLDAAVSKRALRYLHARSGLRLNWDDKCGEWPTAKEVSALSFTRKRE